MYVLFSTLIGISHMLYKVGFSPGVLLDSHHVLKQQIELTAIPGYSEPSADSKCNSMDVPMIATLTVLVSGQLLEQVKVLFITLEILISETTNSASNKICERRHIRIVSPRHKDGLLC